jgi:hypothetical protein
MSDTTLIAIPADPAFVPEPDPRQRARAWFAANYPDADDIEVAVTDHIEFVPSFETFERVLCPACRAEMDMGSWGQQMEEDYSSDDGFVFTKFQLPCCGATASLPELVYEMPQGFARFKIAGRNAGLSGDTPPWPVPEERTQQLAKILGTPIRWIYAHM